MKDSLRGSSVVAKSMLAPSSSKQTLARSMISTYRTGRLTSAKQVGACHDMGLQQNRLEPAMTWDETISKQIKAVFLRGCFTSHTAK